MFKLFDPIAESFKDYFSPENTDDYVCVIGGSNVDVVGSSPLIKGNESNVGKVSISAGGVARNIAENLGRLGIPTQYIGAIGNDYFGNMIIDSLREVNVKLTGLRKVANVSTGSYVAILDNFRSMDYAINDMRASEYIDKEWINVCSDIVSNAKAVLIDCNLKHETIEAIMKIAKGKIFVDPVSMTKAVNILPYLSKLYAIKPNIYEANTITNVNIEKIEDAVEALKILVESNVKNAVITMDKRGVLVYDNGKIKHYYTKDIKPVNVTGAGDAFLATWVASDFLNKDFSESIMNAMVSAVKTMLSMETVCKDLSRVNLEKWRQEVEIHERVLEG